MPIEDGEPITVGETDITKAGFDSDAVDRIIAKVGERSDREPHDVAKLKSMLVNLRAEYDLYRELEKGPSLAEIAVKANAALRKLNTAKAALTNDWLKDLLGSVDRRYNLMASPISNIGVHNDHDSLQPLNRWLVSTDEIKAQIDRAVKAISVSSEQLDAWMRDSYLLDNDYRLSFFRKKARHDNLFVAIPLYEAIYYYLGYIDFSKGGVTDTSVSKSVRMAKAVLDELHAVKPVRKKRGRYVAPEPYTHDAIIAIWLHRRAKKASLDDKPGFLDDTLRAR